MNFQGTVTLLNFPLQHCLNQITKSHSSNQTSLPGLFCSAPSSDSLPNNFVESAYKYIPLINLIIFAVCGSNVLLPIHACDRI